MCGTDRETDLKFCDLAHHVHRNAHRGAASWRSNHPSSGRAIAATFRNACGGKTGEHVIDNVHVAVITLPNARFPTEQDSCLTFLELARIISVIARSTSGPHASRARRPSRRRSLASYPTPNPTMHIMRPRTWLHSTMRQSETVVNVSL